MRKRFLLLLVVLLITLAFIARWYLPRLLSFAGAHADFIQSLTNLVQLATWISAAVVAIAGVLKRKKTSSSSAPVANPPAPAVNQSKSVHASGTGAVAAETISNSTVVTGNDNAILVGAHFTINEAQAPTHLHQVPPAVDDFIDRHGEVTELEGELGNGTRVYGFFGMGGVGKSDLAKKFAAEHLSDQYPDAQFFINLKGTSPQPKSVSDVQSHVVGSCHSTEKAYGGENVDLEAKYNNVWHGKRALLLLDNVTGDEQLEPLIPPAKCAMVITSRKRVLLPGMHAMTVPALDPENARNLLLKIAPRIGSEAGEIAKLCGHLPLALRLAAQLIAERPDVDVADFVRGLRERTQRLEGVEASLDLSYGMLPEERRNQFCRLAVFPETFDAGGAAAIWSQPIDVTKSILSDLYKFSLIEWNESARRYRMQTLVRDFADARLDESERRTTQARHAFYSLEVLRQAGRRYLQGDRVSRDGINLFDIERANIETAQAWVETNLADDAVSSAARDTYSYSGSRLLGLKQPPSVRIKWHNAMLSAAREPVADETQRSQRLLIEAVNLTFLGIAFRDLADYDKTIEHCDRALQIAKQLKNEREESNALGYSGIAYYYKGNYAEAKNRGQRAVDLAAALEEKDQPATAEKLRYLGHAYRGLNEYEQAAAAYERSLVIVRKLNDLSGESNALSAMGRIYCDTGRYETARTELLPKALQLAKEIGNRKDECYGLGHLGLAHRDVGMTTEAVEYYEQALKLAEEIDHKQVVAYSHGGLGKVYLAIKDFAKAIENTEVAIKVAREIGMRRAMQHWETLLSQLYLYAGDLKKALAMVESARTHNSPWENHRSAIIHGLIFVKLGELEKAGAAFGDGLESAKTVLAKTPSYFDARYVSALALCGLARVGLDDAEMHVSQSTQAYEEAFANCSAPGIVGEGLDLLDLLINPGDSLLQRPRERLLELSSGAPNLPRQAE